MTTDFKAKAIELGTIAIEADRAGKLQIALDNYIKAVTFFLTAIKYEKNPMTKQTLEQKTNEYMQRAEYLKEQIRTGGSKKTPGKGGTAQKKPGDPDNDDGEKTKFSNIISAAIVSEKPNVKFSDVAGLFNAKESLRETVLLPQKFPHLFTGKRKPFTGILLYGPPGTGKSYLAKAVATEITGSTFYSVSSSDLLSKWLGESEKIVRELFSQARSNAPSIIFIDEIDSLCSSRGEGESESARRVKTEFLVQMNGVGKGGESGRILTLGATNLPDVLDSAIRRRFQKRIYIPLPDFAARHRMFQIHIGNTPNLLTQSDWRILAKKTDGYSGSDIAILCQDAIMQPVRKIQSATHFKHVSGPDPQEPESEQIFNDLLMPCSPGETTAMSMSWEDVPGNKLVVPPVTRTDFMLSLNVIKPSVAPDDLSYYDDWTEKYGSEG